MKPPLTLEQAFDPKRNAVAFVRLALASLVIVSHSYMLGGFGEDPLGRITWNKENFGFLGVTMFFTLSGFLITGSAARSSSLARFFWHRFLRIFPGYAAVLALSAFVLAPLFYRLEFGSYLGVFSAPGSPAVSYFFGNLGMFHPNFESIASVLTIHPASIATLLFHNPCPRIFNGSLWSLPYECVCYLGVGFLAIFGVLRNRRHLTLVFLLLLVGLYAFDCFNHRLFEQSFPSRGFGMLVVLALYFCMGSVGYLYREKIPVSWILFCVALAIMIVSAVFGIVPLTGPLILPYVLLWLICRLRLTRADAHGDFSYGAYIYAFPVQQGLVLLHVNSQGFPAYLACSFGVTLVLAFFSYRCIEEPFLRLKNVQLRWLQSKSASPVSPAKEPNAAAVAVKA